MDGKAVSKPRSATNRHPVDQIAEVRESIKALKEREDALKTEIETMMGSSSSLGGDDYIASLTESERKGGLDEKKLKAAGVKVDAFRKPSTVVYTLRVSRRALEEGAE